MNLLWHILTRVNCVRRTLSGCSGCVRQLRRLLRRGSQVQTQARLNRSEFYRDVWEQAAQEHAAGIVSLGHEFLEIRKGRHSVRVRQNYTPLEDCVALAVAGDKLLTSRILGEHGLPVPQSVEYSLANLALAEAFLEGAQGPCVVKPAADSAGGAGVTTGVEGRWHLLRASLAASQYAPRLLVQTQLSGDNYRLLYLDGVLLDAVLLRPPSVVGDGRRKVRELLEELNRARLEQGQSTGQRLVVCDYDMQRTLATQGLRLDSVVPSGIRIRLKTIVNENAGSDTECAVQLLHDQVIAAGATAARSLGVRLAGVDIITTNPEVPLGVSGGAILEVNTTPGFYWHYVRQDGACPVAEPILERMLLDAESTSPVLPSSVCTHLASEMA